MHSKKEKNYWQKCKERLRDRPAAQARAGALRAHAHVSHVKVEKLGDAYAVSYSVAKWYLDELRAAGIEL
jgi:hypothetical protein